MAVNCPFLDDSGYFTTVDKKFTSEKKRDALLMHPRTTPNVPCPAFVTKEGTLIVLFPYRLHPGRWWIAEHKINQKGELERVSCLDSWESGALKRAEEKRLEL